MRRKNELPELLAPAGDFECLVAAVNAGADAVYVGGKAFSARAYAKNFDEEELRRAVAYCHLHGARLYVTLNTLLYDNEIPEAVAFARALCRIGVDALIVADLGLVRVLRAAVPSLELHASTQMSLHNTEGADAAYDLGCTRVVLARELSLADVKSVTERARAEIEIFLHGALCVSYSGQCLFSSLVGGRSGNRGECAQPCRLPYNGGGYPLSLKDLSLARHIPALIESGVASLKIEGRMKSPDYVYTVTSIYRRLLDERRGSNADEDRALMRAFSREGFTDAYLRGHPEERMTGVRTEADKAESKAVSGGEYSPRRVPVSAEARILLGEPASLTLRDKRSGRCVTVTGDVPAPARNAPLTAPDVKSRLCKVGNTFLSLDASDIVLDMDEGVNLSPSSINALRRAACDAFECPTTECPELPMPEMREKLTRGGGKKHKTAVFYRVLEYNKLPEGVRLFDVEFIPLWQFSDGLLRRSPNGVALPPVITDSEMGDVRRMLENARSRGVEYALVGNIGHIPLAYEYGLKPIGDFRFNVMNGYTRDALDDMGIDDVMASVEMTSREAASLSSRVCVYGRIPLMLTERCFMRDTFGCRSCSEVGLTDRRGFEFPMVREYEHRNLIFNSALTYIGDKPKERGLFDGEHYIFSTESAEEILSVIDAYKTGKAPTVKNFRRIGRREFKK